MEDVIFIQIGSNEGVMASDPLCSLILKEGWKGVLVEPVPHIFERLKKNYAGRPYLFFENAAVSDKRGRRPFYIVDEEAEFFKKNPHLVNEVGGPWGSLVSSFDRDYILKHKPGLTEREIKTIEVECITLEDIVDKYRLGRIDVIHMDTEGHDGAILLSINFNRLKPKIIIFEHAHMTFERYLACIHHLNLHGYCVAYTGSLDTIVAKS